MVLDSATSPPAPAQPASPRSSRRRWRILYAEDVRELREVARMALPLDGHSIECVVHGKFALERVMANPHEFTLIITDHHMPVMNGLELVQNLRTRNYPGKIIVFCSELQPLVHDAYVALGVDRVLPKPIFPSELRKVLAEL